MPEQTTTNKAESVVTEAEQVRNNIQQKLESEDSVSLGKLKDQLNSEQLKIFNDMRDNHGFPATASMSGRTFFTLDRIKDGGLPQELNDQFPELKDHMDEIRNLNNLANNIDTICTNRDMQTNSPAVNADMKAGLNPMLIPRI